MTYSAIDFKNLPNTTTPLSAANMNHIQTQYSEAAQNTLETADTLRGEIRQAETRANGYTDNAILGISEAGSRANLIESLRYPVYIAHRGSRAVYPEHSIEAYRASFNAGFSPEADVRALEDGTLVCIHDATTNRTMNINKSVSSTTVAEWRSAGVLPPKSADGRIFGAGAGTPVFFEDYLDEFGGKILLWPEIKVTGEAAQRCIRAVIDRGLQRQVVLQSSDLQTCRQISEAGCTPLLLSNTSSAQSALSAGVRFIGVSSAATNQYVTDMVNAGLSVIAYTMNTKQDADRELARGCVGVFSDDPWEASREFTSARTLNLNGGMIPPASRQSRGNSSTDGGSTQIVTVESDTLLFTTSETSAGRHNALRLGELGFGLPYPVKIQLWVESLSTAQTTSPESTWLFGVYLGKQTDDVAVNEEAQESMFRLAMVRRDGRKHAYEKRTLTGGVSSLGSTAQPSTPYATPGGRSAPMLFEVEFNSTSVAIRNLTLNDTDLVATGTTLTISGAYLTLSQNGANARIWGVRRVS